MRMNSPGDPFHPESSLDHTVHGTASERDSHDIPHAPEEIIGKVFDPENPEEYVRSFAISNLMNFDDQNR